MPCPSDSTQLTPFPLRRILLPQVKKRNGTGISSTLIHANTMVPQFTPRPEYIRSTNSGNAPAAMERRKVFAASALALYLVNVSIRQVNADWKTQKKPNPVKTMPMMDGQ